MGMHIENFHNVKSNITGCNTLQFFNQTFISFTKIFVITGDFGRKEMFYLTMHSTHFIYGYMASDIWLRTILIVRKETHCRHIGYSFRLTARFFYMHHPTDRIAHTTAFVTPVVVHWLEREIAQWVHPMKDRSDDPSHHERTLYL